MNFIHHTLNWCRGEIFEGKIFALYGLVVVVISIIFWKTGKTTFTKTMFVPLLIVGLLCTIAGASLVINNNKRINDFQMAFEKDPGAFVKSEKERTDNFIKWYPYTHYIMAAITIIGLGSFILWGSAWGRAIGLGLILLAFSILFLDHFSEERADIYHKKIVVELKTE
jgi:hypothetical protein